MPLPDKHTDRLRVLIGADTFPPDVNGASRFTRDLAVRLSARGHTVHVVAPASSRRHGTYVETFGGQRIAVHRLRSFRWPAHEWLRFAPPWELGPRIDRLLEHLQPQVVHSQSFINIGRVLTGQAHQRGIPVVATNHVMPDNIIGVSGLPRSLHPGLTRYGWHLASKTLARAAVVTSTTPIAADYLAQHTGLETIEPVSCGVDTSRFPFHPHRPVDHRILYVGRLDPEKHVDQLLRAFSLMNQSLGAYLDIVGGGAESHRLQQLAARLGVADRVRFHGRISDEELERLYPTASVFVMASTAELQSIATLEAMASGTPVVLADAMALPHLIDNGHNGILVPPGEPRGLAEAIETILTLPHDAYTTMRHAARHKAEEHDSQIVIQHYEQLYRTAEAPRGVYQH